MAEFRKSVRLLLSLAVCLVILTGAAVAENIILAVPQGLPMGDPAFTGPVFLLELNKGNGTLTPLPPIPPGSAFDCIYSAFDKRGELFVTDRQGGWYGNGGGSVTRFLVNKKGEAIPNGVITGNGLSFMTGIVFLPSGELLGANMTAQTISRFTFDAAGDAVPNGVINLGYWPQGLAVNEAGELFVSDYTDSLVQRYLLVDGTPVPNGSIPVPGGTGIHGLGFSPSGELFVCNPSSSTVYRFLLDAAGNAKANGEIAFPAGTGTLGIAFSPDGELFVTTHGNLPANGFIYRFLFDATGAAIANGTYDLGVSLGGPAIHIYRGNGNGKK
jgi:sugar lactone lactonase YvrE